jgi:protein-S-isoprenylcysteine O-methyltransferase Ste14
MTQAEGERGAIVRFPPPLVYLGAVLAGVALRYLVTPARLPDDYRTIGLWGGIVLIGAGLSLIIPARLLFFRTKQSPIPWKPSPELIFRGPYRFTRNPMYVGLTLIVLGIGFGFDNLWISLCAPIALLIVHFIAVRPEERYLSDKFGDSYRTYLIQVRRYL